MATFYLALTQFIAHSILLLYVYVRATPMNCNSGERKEEPPAGSPASSTYEKIKAHAKEFMEATPEEHKQ